MHAVAAPPWVGVGNEQLSVARDAPHYPILVPQSSGDRVKSNHGDRLSNSANGVGIKLGSSNSFPFLTIVDSAVLGGAFQ